MSQDVSDVCTMCHVGTVVKQAVGTLRETADSDGNTKDKGLASFCGSNTGIQTDLWSHERDKILDLLVIEIWLKFLQQVSVLKDSSALKVCLSLIRSDMGQPSPLSLICSGTAIWDNWDIHLC